MVRTPDSHSGNPGSTPGSVTQLSWLTPWQKEFHTHNFIKIAELGSLADSRQWDLLMLQVFMSPLIEGAWRNEIIGKPGKSTFGPYPENLPPPINPTCVKNGKKANLKPYWLDKPIGSSLSIPLREELGEHKKDEQQLG